MAVKQLIKITEKDILRVIVPNKDIQLQPDFLKKIELPKKVGDKTEIVCFYCEKEKKEILLFVEEKPWGPFEDYYYVLRCPECRAKFRVINL